MVEDLLKDLHGGPADGTLGLEDGQEAPVDDWDDAAAADGDGSRAQLLQQLQQLGFRSQDATAALRAAGPEIGAAAAAGGALQQLLDWLCLHLPDDRLPPGFAPGVSQPVSVVRRKGDAAAAAAVATGGGSTSGWEAAGGEEVGVSCLEDPHVLQLLDWGYPLQPAITALAECGGHLQRALTYLCQQLTAGSADTTHAAAAGGDAAFGNEAWQEEMEALEAIYAEELSTPEPGHCRLTVQCAQVEDPVQLLVWCSEGPAEYPAAPPVLALQCQGLAPMVRLHLTQQLLQAAAGELLGSPMVYDLAVQVTEVLEEGVEGLGDKVQSWPAPFDQTAGAAAKKQQQQSQQQQQRPGLAEARKEDGVEVDGAESAAADEAEHIMQRTSSSSQLRQLERQQQQQAGTKRKAAYGEERGRGRQRTAAEAAALSSKLLQHQQKLEVGAQLLLCCRVSMGMILLFDACRACGMCWLLCTVGHMIL